MASFFIIAHLLCLLTSVREGCVSLREFRLMYVNANLTTGWSIRSWAGNSALPNGGVSLDW